MVNWNEEDYQKHLQRVEKDHQMVLKVVLGLLTLAFIGVLSLGVLAITGFFI